MSYFLFPKNSNEVFFSPICNNNIHSLNHTSHSLYNYCIKLQKDLNNLFMKTNEPNEYFYYLLAMVNPYYFVLKYVNDNNLIKEKPNSNIFFDLLEIFKITKLFENFEENYLLTNIHIGFNCDESKSCLSYVREKLDSDKLNKYLSYNNNHLFTDENEKRFDYIFCEIGNIYNNINDYVINFLEILMIILKYQFKNGVCVIKIDNVFYKPIIDILYIFSTLYENIYIVKPTTSNPISFERYLVCKNFIFNDEKKIKYKKEYFEIGNFIYNFNLQDENKNIVSILDYNLPIYFMNKIDDMNIMIGHHQLETLHILFTILKSKNKEEKIENLKKNNLQKCIAWCEKINIIKSCKIYTNKYNNIDDNDNQSYGSVEPI
jgi:hypothetical protein